MQVRLHMLTFVFYFVLYPFFWKLSFLPSLPFHFKLTPSTLPIPSAFQFRLIAFYLLFHTVSFLIETYAAFHRLLHPLFRNNLHVVLNVTARCTECGDTLPIIMWRRFTKPYKANELFMNTHTVGHRYWHTSVLLNRLLLLLLLAS